MSIFLKQGHASQGQKGGRSWQIEGGPGRQRGRLAGRGWVLADRGGVLTDRGVEGGPGRQRGGGPGRQRGGPDR